MHRDADIARLAQFGYMDVMRCIGAAHVERVLGALGTHHAEVGEKLFLSVEIGRAQPPVCEIKGLDYRHRVLQETFALCAPGDRKSTRLNSSHLVISYAVFCLKKKNKGKLFRTHIRKYI